MIDHVKALVTHDTASIERAADRLSMMHAVIDVPFIESDVALLTRDECVGELVTIRDMSVKELSSRRGIEESLEKWYGPEATAQQRQNWIRYVKRSRAEQLVRAFELVSRLRSDEPEAWDEINELYYDD